MEQGRHPAPPAHDDPRLGAWRAFLYAQATLMARLDAELQADAGLTLAEFDALAQLGFAARQRLRMGELADRVLLSRSGVTRLVDRLERRGYVGRETCAPDGRGAFAVLTPAGRKVLRSAMPRHLAGVDSHFLEAIGPEDLEAVERALGRVAQANGRPLPSPEASAEAVGRVTGSPPR
ncbi:MarR family transcriptional regulator [soil metagenome]